MARAPRKSAAGSPSARKAPRKPAAAKPAPGELPQHEFAALCLEAYEAHDFSSERVRFDSRGRKWSFAPDKEAGHSVIRLRIEHLTASAEDVIRTDLLATDERLAHIGQRLTGLAAKLA